MTPKINDLGFDNLNSCCKPLERPSKELVRQLDILAVERRPEACLAAGWSMTVLSTDAPSSTRRLTFYVVFYQILTGL